MATLPIRKDVPNPTALESGPQYTPSKLESNRNILTILTAWLTSTVARAQLIDIATPPLHSSRIECTAILDAENGRAGRTVGGAPAAALFSEIK